MGLAIGAASGLALGALYDVDDIRVGEDFLDDVSKSLTPNKVAVVAEVEEEWTTPVDTRMEALGGTVLRRALWEVEKTVDEQEIAAMKADLEQLKSEISKAHADRKAKLQKKIDRARGEDRRAAEEDDRSGVKRSKRARRRRKTSSRRTPPPPAGPSKSWRTPPSETRKSNKENLS